MSRTAQKRIANFYSERFFENGVSVKSVGWGSREDQELRFEMLLSGIDLKDKVVLDVGCGLGDLVSFLDERYKNNFEYIGVDVTAPLVEEARMIHRENSRVKFYEGDIFSVSLPSVDVAVLSGTLTFKTVGIKGYARRTMVRMFELSHRAACLNFMSKLADYELKKNQHYDPIEVLSWASSISKKINLFHSYPLHEFTIQVYKSID